MRFVWSLFLFCACSCATSQSYTNSMLRRASQSSVLVKTNHGQGSGTVVFSGAAGSLVLTCAHVVGQAEMIYVVLHDSGVSATHPAFLYKISAKIDLALLFVPRVRLPSLPVAREAPQIADNLFVIANPKGFFRVLSPGFLVNKDLEGLWQYWGFALPGSSGGSVIDVAGQLVCVANAGVVDVYPVFVGPRMSPEALVGVTGVPSGFLSFCIPLSDIQEFLKGASL